MVDEPWWGFTEKELELFNKYIKEGYNMKEALELSNPKKYNDLLGNDPHVLKIFRNNILEFDKEVVNAV